MTTEQTKSASLSAIRRPQENYSASMRDLQGFELMQRQARLLSGSTLVPAQYRAFIEKKGKASPEWEENPNALSNCVVALNMAQRMGADPIMVMQNLYVVEGRPSWSSQWIIAAINGCGRFSPLRFDISDQGEKTVEYVVSSWEYNPETKRNEKRTRKEKATVQNLKCVAWAVEKETGARIESPAVTIEMAVKEGWYGKNGSKWQTMPEVMLRYRTASFFGKLYAPELLMGISSVEESQDIIDVNPDGSYTVSQQAFSTDDLRQAPVKPAEVVEEAEVVTEQTTHEPVQAGSGTKTDQTFTFAEVNERLIKAKTMDELDESASLITLVQNPAHQEELRKVYQGLKHPGEE